MQRTMTTSLVALALASLSMSVAQRAASDVGPKTTKQQQSERGCSGTSVQVAGQGFHCIDWERHFSKSRTFRECWKSEAGSKVCGPELVAIPPGSFRMGAVHLESATPDNLVKFWWSWQLPVHKVTVRHPFAASKYEAKLSEYLACVDAGACAAPVWMRKGHKHDISRGTKDWVAPGMLLAHYGTLSTIWEPNSPVIGVSWGDAQDYIGWLNRIGETTSYRLLSEAEWEYAARAGTSTIFPWGDAVGDRNANCDGCGSRPDRLMPVGSYTANAFGLYDMHGNVAEWVQDCFADSYRNAPPNENPWQWAACPKRVTRDGSWFNPPTSIWSSFRAGFEAGYTERTCLSP